MRQECCLLRGVWLIEEGRGDRFTEESSHMVLKKAALTCRIKFSVGTGSGATEMFVNDAISLESG